MFSTDYLLSILFLVYSILLVLPYIQASTNANTGSPVECSDKSPYCNINDCTVRPGYALEYCKKTCGNCEVICQNSHFVSCKQERKSECDSMLKDYCPLLCGICKAPKEKIKRPKLSLSAIRASLNPPLSTTTQMASVSPNSSSGGAKYHISEKKLNQIDGVPTIPSTVPVNTTKVAESSKTAAPYAMPPFYTMSPLTSTSLADRRLYPQLLENNIESAGAPLNIDAESNDEETEWVHEPTSPYQEFNQSQSQPTAIFLPELPDPQMIVSPYGYGAYPAPVNGNSYTNSLMSWNYNSANAGYGRYPNYRNQGPASYVQTQMVPRRSPLTQGSGLITPSQYPVQPLPYAHSSLQYPPMGQPIFNGYIAQPYGYNHRPTRTSSMDNPLALSDLVSLLGCRDRDPSTCSKISDEACHSRPGFYLKLCPVKCKNCNGLQCFDSIKVDCEEVKRLNGCKLPSAAEYCPRTCGQCPPPPGLADSLSPCKDEMETCEHLAESGVCDHPYSREALRVYCAKSCGFCKEPQYYMNDVPYFKNRKTNKKGKGFKILNKERKKNNGS